MEHLPQRRLAMHEAFDQVIDLMIVLKREADRRIHWVAALSKAAAPAYASAMSQSGCAVLTPMAPTIKPLTMSGTPPSISTNPAVVAAMRPLWMACSSAAVGLPNSAAVRAFARASSVDASMGEPSMRSRAMG